MLFIRQQIPNRPNGQRPWAYNINRQWEKYRLDCWVYWNIGWRLTDVGNC